MIKFLVCCCFYFVFFIDVTLGAKGDCNFANGNTCEWTSSNTPNFTWSTCSGSTETHLTGPSADRKGSKTGLYACVDGSEPAKQGDQATLKSPLLEATGNEGHCMCLFYNLHGEGVGRLFVETSTEKGVIEPLFVVSGNQGNAWHKKCLTITQTKKYAVKIVAERGKNALSDIAIDDISFTNEKCPALNFAPGLNDKPNIPNEPEPAIVFGATNKGCFQQSGRLNSFPRNVHIRTIRGDDPDTIKVARNCRDFVLSNGNINSIYAIRNQHCFYNIGHVDMGNYVASAKCDDYIGIQNGLRIYEADRTKL